MSGLPSLEIVRHPAAQEWLGRLRDARTGRAAFRRALDALAGALVHEAVRDWPTRTERRTTPTGEAEVHTLESSNALVLVILRAALGMLPAALRLLPDAGVGFLGLERDPRTLRPRQYYAKLPPERDGPVLVLDPMLATGGTALHALGFLRDHGIGPERTRLVAAVVAPEGMRAVAEAHPGVRVFAAALDAHLSPAGEIVPGLGDAGDRLFGTER